ncbi:minor capsid protein [Peptoniphilus catoniae]|uniref:minor capsid protein n=1 Tax=Peptoniphilus catoniae TaxID=1660341 RepID=UPI001FEAD076|nr:minor capsid protein [Peptoniphilus catoniae]
MSLNDFIEKSKGSLDPDIEKELNIISRRVRISRLQAMETELKKTIADLMSKEEKDLFNHLEGTYKSRYYKELYELQRITGYDSVREISEEDLKIILNNPWTADGREFSKRIWDRGDKLVNSLKDNLMRDIGRGASPDESIKNIEKQFNASKAAASRLVYTETAAISSKATQDSYEKLGVKQYQILATLDLKTSDICRSMDSKIFDYKDYRIGITAPPFHPNCRSDTVPYFGDEFEKEIDQDIGRMARDPNTGKSGKVEDLSYKEWYNKYVKDNPKAVFKEKAWKNRNTDKDQFIKYKDVLGKDLKNNFEAFQETKYKDKDKYRLLRVDYKRRKKLIDNPELLLPNADKATIDNRKFTKYLFGGENEDGLNKGRLIEKKLGYNIDNYLEFKNEILKRAVIYPSHINGKTHKGIRYEQKIFMYDKNKNPVNLIVGWYVEGTNTKMTTIFIKEVSRDEFED